MNMKPVAMSVAIVLAVSTGAVFAQQTGSTEHQTSNDASEVVSDAWITSKIKADLLAAHETPGMAIDVDTKDGAVTLNGTVKSQAEADKAVAHAKTIKGVKHVTSKLKVEPAKK
jgi:hyperosmotically inducible protein